MFFPVWNKKFPIPIAGNSSKKSGVSMSLSKRGDAFHAKFPVFSLQIREIKVAERRSLQPLSTAS
jgi:hypothetical protein